MDSLIPSTLKIDKTALSLVPCFDTSDEKPLLALAYSV